MISTTAPEIGQRVHFFRHRDPYRPHAGTIRDEAEVIGVHRPGDPASAIDLLIKNVVIEHVPFGPGYPRSWGWPES